MVDLADLDLLTDEVGKACPLVWAECGVGIKDNPIEISIGAASRGCSRHHDRQNLIILLLRSRVKNTQHPRIQIAMMALHLAMMVLTA